MHAQRPCDWQNGAHPLECSNCADHRVTAGDKEHLCEVPRKSILYRKYSEHHPARYDQVVAHDGIICCTQCAEDGVAAACDVDPILGYQCSRCRSVAGPDAFGCCRLRDGTALESRPNVRQGVVKWFRHGCDGCVLLAAARRREAQKIEPCSWLADRTSWDRPCDHCRDNNLVCLSSAMVTSMPAAIRIPETWKPRSFLAHGWAELRLNTAWRKACVNCRRDRNHCRASMASPLSACGRCTAMGLDCVDTEGTAYPIFDLSQVGFGRFMPFTACRRCVDQGRNCDRQRPCDSCTNLGEAHLCDNAFLKTEAGKKRMLNCIHGRLHPRPGPLYYLAHGYGADGVYDAKDGSRMEHWIGPVTDVYAMPSVSFREGKFTRQITRQRESLVPRSTPPHAAPGTPLAGKPASQLTANDIAAMIYQVWPDAFLMNTLPTLTDERNNAISRKALNQIPTPAGADKPPTEADIAAAVNPKPDLGPTLIVTIIQPLPVVFAPAAAEAATDSEEDEYSEESEESEEEVDGDICYNGNSSIFARMVPGPLQATQPPLASDQSVVEGLPYLQGHQQTMQTLTTQPGEAPLQPEPMYQQIMHPLPAAATWPPELIYEQIMQTVGAIAPLNTHDAMDIDALEATPIDPALQPWNPPTPEPVLPYAPFSPLPAVSFDANTMPGHAMMLPKYPTPPAVLDVGNIYTADLLAPNLTSFLTAPATTAEWPPAGNAAHLGQQVNASLSPFMSFLNAAEATMLPVTEGDTTNVDQEMYGTNPFQAMPLQFEEQNQQVPAVAPTQGTGQQRVARWRHLNTLHECTRALLGKRDNTGERVVRKPFTRSVPHLQNECPIKDVLHGLPEPAAEDVSKGANIQAQGSLRCDENDAGEGDFDAYITCGATVHALDTCADEHHDHNHPRMVCNGCSEQSAQILVDPRYNPLTAAEVLKMRSYLCDMCTVRAGSSPEAMLDMCEAGVNRVYGWFPDSGPKSYTTDGDGDVTMTMTARDGGDVKFFSKVRPLTGCSCGVKMFQTRQCQFHRIDNAEAVLHQVAAVREWRIQTLQQGKCAGCFEDRSAVDMPMQSHNDDGQDVQQLAPESPIPSAALNSWVCLACGGWVLNVATPGLVDGWQSWFDRQPASLATITEEVDGMDIDMTNAQQL